MLTKKRWKQIDIVLLLIFPILAAIISLSIKANYLTSILLFFGLPSVWLSYRTAHLIKRTFLYSLIYVIPFTVIVDYLVTIDKGWFVPNSLFPLFLGVIPIEDFVFGFLLVYATIMFYEHFAHHGTHKLLAQRMKYLTQIIIFSIIIFTGILLINPAILSIPYSYLLLGIIFLLIPPIMFLYKYPSYKPLFATIISYFFVLNITFELVALKLGQWIFPGENFIGWVQIFGLRFPFEEFIFFTILFPIAMLTWYKYFDDKPKV